MEQEKPIIVAIYARVSIDPEKYRKDFAPPDGIHKQNIENQLRELREFCKKSNYQIYDEYIDKISGAKGVKDRPEFSRMFLDASKKKFNLLLFWSLDRFSREGVLKTLNYLNELETYKVDWKSYTERYFESAGILKDIIISLLATIAKQERLRISERVKAGIRNKMSKGFHHGRQKVQIDIVEFGKMVRENYSLGAISRRFDISKPTVNRIIVEHKLRPDNGKPLISALGMPRKSRRG